MILVSSYVDYGICVLGSSSNIPCKRYEQLVIHLSNKSPSALFDLYSHIGSITH